MRAKDRKETEMPLHVWTADDEEWVVAESAQDACAVYCEHIGCEPSKNADSGDHGTHPDHWSVLADDRPLKWAEECPEHHKPGHVCPRQCDPDHWIRTRLPCAEHVRRAGRSYLGSANY